VVGFSGRVMPVTYSIDVTRKLIRTTCSGAVTFAEVQDHFRSLSEDPACSGRLDVLLDLGETKSLPETHQLQSLGLALGMVRRRAQFGDCAIVGRGDALFGMMRMFAVFAEKHFREIQVFRMVAEADRWLMSQQSAIDGP
jgi:hypothetical protein